MRVLTLFPMGGDARHPPYHIFGRKKFIFEGIDMQFSPKFKFGSFLGCRKKKNLEKFTLRGVPRGPKKVKKIFSTFFSKVA